MVNDNGGREVPELVRAMLLSPCRLDPPAAFVPVLARLHQAGVRIGDVLADSGYSNRVASTWAIPIRRLGATNVFDLHPGDRWPKGTYAGATLCNGNLYCQATPSLILRLAPLAVGVSEKERVLHDNQAAELGRYKLGRTSADDADGYHRVACPAVAGKLRRPLRPASLSLSYAHPEVTSAPAAEDAPSCCRQKTITVPPAVNAKTAQRHDYPSPAHRESYGRRTAAERAKLRPRSRPSRRAARRG